MSGSLPSLQEFTVCSWLKFDANDNKFLTSISYATSNTSSQIAISLKKSGSSRYVEFLIGKTHIFFACRSKWITVEWYHLCAIWFYHRSYSHQGKVYQNGNICELSGRNPLYSDNSKTIISSGGILVIDQAQDGISTKYNASKAWYGDIADVQIWDEALTSDQIREAGKCNGKRKAGNVFSWMKTEMIATDNVEFSETQLCYL